MPKFRLSNSAVLELMDIAIYGDENNGMDASDAYRARLEYRFSEIAEQPLLYPSVEHIRAGYRRSVLDGLSIYYRIEGDDVVIVRLTIKHASAIPCPNMLNGRV